jgi:NADH-quinone oxidoreductase subunit J
MAIPAFCFAALTVIVKNIVHSVIYLILCLLSLVPIYIALRADFIAAAQVAIYVGAISILIIFAVMFIHDKSSKVISHLNRQTIAGVLVALMLFGVIFYFIFQTKTSPMLGINDVIDSPVQTEEAVSANKLEPITSVQAISETMFGKPGSTGPSQYFIPVQLASFVILAALVGAIEMAKKKEDEL